MFKIILDVFIVFRFRIYFESGKIISFGMIYNCSKENKFIYKYRFIRYGLIKR